VTPFKIGEALKSTQEGVIRVQASGSGYALLDEPYYRRLYIRFKQISLEEYEKSKNKS
jgi:hypothetical protein